MIIDVCSLDLAKEMVRNAQERTAVISVTSLEEDDVEFDLNENVLRILPLKFNDLEREYDEEGIPYGRPLPKQEDFRGLRDFVGEAERLRCERLIIHCREGESRSAAVAKAIYEYRGSTDILRTHQRSAPNTLVYVLARQELGRKG